VSIARTLRRWLVRTLLAYVSLGFVVWVASIVRHPFAYGPIEWLMALAWYVTAWPIYLPMVFGK
jgi:hypothetical protein